MKAQKGFTMTELLVVATIVAILLGIGVPSFKYIGNANRMSGEVNGLLGDLQYARAEAIREGVNVTACASTNGASCSGTTAWATGWIVYSNPLPATTTPNVSVVRRVQNPFGGAFPDVFTSSNAVSQVTFNREGFATTVAGFATTTFTLDEPGANAAYRRCLILGPVGLMTTQTHSINPGSC